MRPRLTYANVVSSLCLFLILGGGAAYAANTVFSSDIVDGQVKTPDLANGAVANGKLAGGAVTSDKVADESLKSRDVLDNTLKGADIDESTLSSIGGGGAAGGDLTGKYPNPLVAPDAVGASEISNAASGSDDVNADLFDGLDSSDVTRPACTSQSGALKGFARIEANAGFSSEFTTTGVAFPYNCSGGTVEARLSSGFYAVRFNGSTTRIALATSFGLGVWPEVFNVGPGEFNIALRDRQGNLNVNKPFVIAPI